MSYNFYPYAKANTPTKNSSSRSCARIPCSYEHQSWTPRSQSSPPQRPHQIERLETLEFGMPRQSGYFLFPHFPFIVDSMLTHKHRFHGHGSLRYVFSKGRNLRSKHFLLRYVPNEQRLHSRFAVVVSKKISKRAVHRNRIRRRVFEVVREHYVQHDSFDISITVFSLEVLMMPSAELTQELTALLASVDTK